MKAFEITKLRERLGMNKSQFAKKLGVGLRSVHRWESGEVDPSPVMVKLLQAITGRSRSVSAPVGR